MWSFWESELLNGSGYQSLGLEQEEFALTISLIALANALASSSGPVVPGVSSGVSQDQCVLIQVVQRTYWWVLVDWSEVGFLGWNFQSA